MCFVEYYWVWPDHQNSIGATTVIIKWRDCLFSTKIIISLESQKLDPAHAETSPSVKSWLGALCATFFLLQKRNSLQSSNFVSSVCKLICWELGAFDLETKFCHWRFISRSLFFPLNSISRTRVTKDSSRGGATDKQFGTPKKRKKKTASWSGTSMNTKVQIFKNNIDYTSRDLMQINVVIGDASKSFLHLSKKLLC